MRTRPLRLMLVPGGAARLDTDHERRQERHGNAQADLETTGLAPHARGPSPCAALGGPQLAGPRDGGRRRGGFQRRRHRRVLRRSFPRAPLPQTGHRTRSYRPTQRPARRALRRGARQPSLRVRWNEPALPGRGRPLSEVAADRQPPAPCAQRAAAAAGSGRIGRRSSPLPVPGESRRGGPARDAGRRNGGRLSDLGTLPRPHRPPVRQRLPLPRLHRRHAVRLATGNGNRRPRTTRHSPARALGRHGPAVVRHPHPRGTPAARHRVRRPGGRSGNHRRNAAEGRASGHRRARAPRHAVSAV